MNDLTIHHEQVAALRGAATPVRTRWTYRASEPFAVTVSFCTERGRWVEWVFARDLLVTGLSEAAGIGDVRIRPDAEDEDVLILQIQSPTGDAVFELDRDQTEEFAEATLDLVPEGDEEAHFDVDRLVGEISGS